MDNEELLFANMSYLAFTTKKVLISVAISRIKSSKLRFNVHISGIARHFTILIMINAFEISPSHFIIASTEQLEKLCFDIINGNMQGIGFLNPVDCRE